MPVATLLSRSVAALLLCLALTPLTVLAHPDHQQAGQQGMGSDHDHSQSGHDGH